MGQAILELIPFVLASAAVPIFVIVTLLLLLGEGGVVKASAFIAGVTLTRLVQGLLFGLLFSAAAAEDDAYDPRSGAAIVMLLLGILLLVKAARTILKVDDEDAPPPRWMTAIPAWSAGKAFVIGAVWVAIAAKLWVFTLGAVEVIQEANLSTGQSAFVYVLFVVAAQSLGIIPVAAAAISPVRAEPVLARTSKLLEAHNKKIIIVVSVIFGIYFVASSLDKLLG